MNSVSENTILAKSLAHQGGWDEALMVLVPLALIGFLLFLVFTKLTKKINTEKIEGE